MTESDLFLAAVEKTDPTERAAFLDEVCAGQPELRRRVEVLLQADAQVGSFLEHPAVALNAASTDTPLCDVETFRRGAAMESLGTIIGRYKLLQKLGEGGMGTVFLAEQTAPVVRQVALKIIKPGMDSDQIIARFEQERQALALMDHPNIAKVLDAGQAGDCRLETGGRKDFLQPPVSSLQPFFVMELVRGIPITRYCDQEHLTTKERLELFVPVCQAVQHAHQKGIIHRDLKPSNVLVALYDGKPIPKVIDFGVAKATAQKLTERTMFTEVGQLIGTLEYMAPEQAELNNLDIDTRADIYSLGVLLYELLTGSPPFTAKQLRAEAFTEMLRIIREVEPPKPSTKISSSAELPRLAAQRNVEPQRLTKLVHGELDWIAMKCLAKERSQRYETANGLALDVQRYLADEPVLAGPPSARYRLRKFVRRHRGPVLAASLMLVTLLAGIVGTTWQAIRAEQARDAEAARAEGEKQAKEQAQQRLAQNEKLSGILADVFFNLDPRAEERENRPLRVILGDRLVKAAEQLEGEAVGAPLLVAYLQNRLGKSLVNLGMPERAIPLFAKSRATRTAHLGPDHRDTLVSTNNLAEAYKAAGKVDQALPLWEQAIHLMKVTLGPDHRDTLISMSNLAEGYRAAGKLDQALPLYVETLSLQKATLGPDHPDTLLTMNNLALGYYAAGKTDQAVPLWEQTLQVQKVKLPPNHPDTLSTMNNLAMGYFATGKRDQAMTLWEEILRLRKAELGPEHPDTLSTMNLLATGYQAQGKLDLALPLFEQTLRLRKARLGPNHPDTLISMNNLAMAYQAAGKLDQALPLTEETLQLQKAQLGPDHPFTLVTMNNLGLMYRAKGKLEQALALHQAAAVGIEKRRYQHEHAGKIVRNLISCQEHMKQFDQAEPWRRKWLAAIKARSGSDSLLYASELPALALNLLRQKKLDAAEAVLREALSLYEQKEPDAWMTFNIKSLLGVALLNQKKYTEAEPLLLQGYEGMKQRVTTGRADAATLAQQQQRLTEILQRLVYLYETIGKQEQAAKWRKEWEQYQAATKKGGQP